MANAKHIRMIEQEFMKACEKHPKFCDELIPPGFEFSEDEERWKKWNDESTVHYACDLFNEEFYEALNAYQQGNREHCLQELAQCSAVILRMMQYVEEVRWANGDTCKGGNNEKAQSKSAILKGEV